MDLPKTKAVLSIKSLDGLHKAGLKLRESKVERERFVKDPVAYFKNVGLDLPDVLQVELKKNAMQINNVLAGKHDPIASIAVA